MGITFFSDDTQIRTTEDQAYRRTVYLLDHNVIFIIKDENTLQL